MSEHREKFNRLLEWVKKWKFEIISILIMAIIAVLGGLDAYHYKYLIGKGRPITLEYLLGSLGAITTIYLVWRRTKGQEEQIKIQTEQIKKQEEQIAIQIKKEVDDRFTTAVNLLGSSETSARTGAIYSLYQQAVDYEKYRKQIVQILCSHIRSKTQEPEYQKQHKDRPSNEIQTTIDVLFGKIDNEGLYTQFEEEELPNADLSYAYCVGADFWGAHCLGADFRGADCQKANFMQANCQDAYFMKAHCQGTEFVVARCQGAHFRETNCQGASFEGADCQGAYFDGASCQGASFIEASCQRADFEGASCQEAYFGKSSCQGASFMHAHCQGANFEKADCEGVNFSGARCQGASFKGTYCQEAYSSSMPLFLEDRIDENTGLQVVLEGALSQQSIDAIEKAKQYCSPEWYSKMQKIIEKNKDKEEKCSPPDGIIFERLEYEELLNS